MKFKHYDRILFFTALVLLGAGVVMVYSTSSYYAQVKFGDSSYFLKRQALFATAGLIAMAVMMVIDYHWWRKLVYPILGTIFVLLILVFVPGIGRKAGGAMRWIDLGVIWLQPSELAKLALVIYLAHSLIKKRDKLGDFAKGFLPHMVVVGVMCCLVIIQPDFGTAMTLGAIAMGVLCVCGVRLSHILATVSLVFPLVVIAMFGAEYRRRRLLAFLDPWGKVEEGGFQIVQSFLAMGNGGIYGVGLGEGKQKLFYLPLAHTDFILSVIGEELGLIGVCALIGAFILLIARGLRASLRAPDDYGGYLAVGITLMIAIQAVLNMAVVVGLLPTKGLPLPFLSYGGTSLVVTMASIGILLNITAYGSDESSAFWRGYRR